MKALTPYIILPFFLFLVFTMEAQKTELEGRVYSKNEDVSGTHIINSTTHRATIADANGFFSIPVRLNDTLIFSAVQFKPKEIVVTKSVFDSKLLFVPLEDALTELSEVIVRLYNLSGSLSKDTKIDTTITAISLGLPNNRVKLLTQSERELYTARTWDFKGTSIKFDPIINYFSGRTKRLKKRVSRDRSYTQAQKLRKSYSDSFYLREFNIPMLKIDDFIYFCEVDPSFLAITYYSNPLRVLDFLRRKSREYRKNNELD